MEVVLLKSGLKDRCGRTWRRGDKTLLGKYFTHGLR